MDVERFQRELPRLFERFPESPRPRDRRFEKVLEAVPGLARENNLALLNLAAGLLGPGESYYDAAHDYESQLRGLRLVEPHLAREALLVVDDSDWDEVRRATADYLAGQPQAHLVFDIPGGEGWWEGMQVLAWREAEPA